MNHLQIDILAVRSESLLSVQWIQCVYRVTAMTLIRLHLCTDKYESSLVAHGRWLTVPHCDTKYFFKFLSIVASVQKIEMEIPREGHIDGTHASQYTGKEEEGKDSETLTTPYSLPHNEDEDTYFRQ